MKGGTEWKRWEKGSLEKTATNENYIIYGKYVLFNPYFI